MEREALEGQYGQVWTTDEVASEFIIVAFSAPFVEAIKKDSGETGILEFQHCPRFYFSWRAA